MAYIVVHETMNLMFIKQQCVTHQIKSEVFTLTYIILAFRLESKYAIQYATFSQILVLKTHI